MANKRWRDDYDEDDDWDDDYEEYERPTRDGHPMPPEREIEVEEEEVTMGKKIKSVAFNISKDLIVVLGILVIIIVVLVVYTGSWPPVVVIESGSMMHHDNSSEIGALDTGDMVLLKSVEEHQVDREITTWVEKEDKHYGTWGDVIIFKKNGEEGTPICHRAVVWLEFNDTDYDEGNHSGGSYDVPSKNLKGINSAFTLRDYPSFSSNRTKTVDLYIDVGGILNIYRMLNMTPASGFITKGDNNPDIDQPVLSQPVQKNWILGKAKGEIPWYGLVNLRAQGNPNPVPANSYAWFFFSLAIIIATPFALDFGIRAIWRWKKKEKPDEAIVLGEEYEAQGLRRDDDWGVMEGDGWDAWDEYEDVKEEGPKLRPLSDDYDTDIANSYWEWYYHEGRMRDYDPRRRPRPEEAYDGREPPPPPPQFTGGERRRPRYQEQEPPGYRRPSRFEDDWDDDEDWGDAYEDWADDDKEPYGSNYGIKDSVVSSSAAEQRRRSNRRTRFDDDREPPPPPRRRGGGSGRKGPPVDDYYYDRPRRRQQPPPPSRRRRPDQRRSMGRQGRTAPQKTGLQRSDRRDHYFYFRDEYEDDY